MSEKNVPGSRTLRVPPAGTLCRDGEGSFARLERHPSLCGNVMSPGFTSNSSAKRTRKNVVTISHQSVHHRPPLGQHRERQPPVFLEVTESL